MIGRACIAGLMAMVVFSTTPAWSSNTISDCERAATMRKHVANAEKMPAEIKQELLELAQTLCPEKGDASTEMKDGERLISEGKVSEALEHFQKAVALDPKLACAKALEVARKLRNENQPALAKAYFEAGLSFCEDEQAFNEYQKLVKESPDALEAKGSGDLIGKDVIVESLRGRERPPREKREERRSRYRGDGDDDEDARVVFHSILFETGSATLTPSSSRQLDELGRALNSPALADVDLFYIDGHTDSIGSEESNCDLGYQRARSVIRYLVDKWDIRPKRLASRSFGEYRPIASNAAALGRLLNRRVEVKNGDLVGSDDSRSGRCR